MSSLSINSNTLSSAFSLSNFNDKGIKMLEKQKMSLHEQIQKVSESKMDDLAKQEKIKEIKDQIEQIDRQIQQKQLEKLRQTNKSQETSKKDKENTEDHGIYGSDQDLAGMTALIQVGNLYSQAKKMNSIKKDVQGQARILKMEIALDSSRGASIRSNDVKKEKLRELEEREQALEKKVDAILKKSQKQGNKAKEKETEKASQKGREEKEIKKEAEERRLKEESLDKVNFQDIDRLVERSYKLQISKKFPKDRRQIDIMF